jgi:hypothetical protein
VVQRLLYLCLTAAAKECAIQRATLTTTDESLHETNDSIKFLQPYPVVAADTLLEDGTTVILAVLSLDEHLSQTNTSCVSKFCYQ